MNALWERLDGYLHEDNIRPQLVSSIQGLGVCREKIERKAEGAWWRKTDKEAAVYGFLNTLSELEFVLQNLTYGFYPGYSGMGVQTLVPIYELITRVRDDFRFRRSQDTDFELVHEELGELATQAVRDDSHEEWFLQAAKVEALITELQLAFSQKVIKAATSNS